MTRKRFFFIIYVFLILATGSAFTASARTFNDKVLNRPYADQRPWHLGFSVGIFASDLMFTHNGFITDAGEQWRLDQPSYQPGFCVNGLFNLRLNDYFSVRFTPGMYFGSRDISMREVGSEATERQNIKSTYVVVPVDVKYSAMRWRNARPYLVAGVLPAFDVSKKRSDILQLKSTDFMLSVGFGFDFYLPYFKLSPEVKFCFGLSDVLRHDRPDLADDPDKFKFTQSISKAVSKMIVLTFYFE
ncbi:MAG: PorT family protein [Bacteroidales bacterium]|nr:PorT family protein [Bacteroidales bacterium]